MSTSDDDSANDEPSDGFSLPSRGQYRGPDDGEPTEASPKAESADEAFVVEWFQRDPDGGEG